MVLRTTLNIPRAQQTFVSIIGPCDPDTGQVWDECGHNCQPMCEPEPPGRCSIIMECIPTCVCPLKRRYRRRDGVCVPENQCDK